MRKKRKKTEKQKPLGPVPKTPKELFEIHMDKIEPGLAKAVGKYADFINPFLKMPKLTPDRQLINKEEENERLIEEYQQVNKKEES